MVISAFGQDPIDVEFANRFRIIKHNDVTSGDYEGSPYLVDDYQPAKISITERIYSVRYNAFEDRMEILSKGVAKALPLMDNLTIEFINQNKVYKVFTNKKGKQGYFVVLYVGNKASLLSKETIEFKEAVKPQSGYDKYKPPMFKRGKDQHYLGYANGTTSMLSGKKKEFYTVFGESADEIKKYVKSEKLNIRDSNDLIGIFKYYDSL